MRDYCISTTVEPILKDHPIGHKNVVCQDRWSLVTGSVLLKCRSCQKRVVCQDRWSLMTGFTVCTYILHIRVIILAHQYRIFIPYLWLAMAMTYMCIVINVVIYIHYLHFTHRSKHPSTPIHRKTCSNVEQSGYMLKGTTDTSI